MNFFKGLRGFPYLAVFIAALLVAAAFLFLERWEAHPDRTEALKSRATETPGKRMTGETASGKPTESAHAGQRIAIIIDDIGFDLPLVRELAKFKAPIAYAVLPHTPHAAEAAAILHAAGKEILLHLPMEPLAYPAEDPGAGALFVDMNEQELRRRMEAALAAVPHVRGVNNHMGSRFMKDEAGVAVVMDELSRRGLFFVDSRTAPDSRGREAAARVGIPFAARDLFIDHAPGYEAALAALVHPPLHEGRKRELLLIGHPHPETLRALQEALPRWRAEGVHMIPVSAYVRLPGGRENRENSGMNRSQRQMSKEGNP